MVSWSRRGWKVEIRGHLTFWGSVIFRYHGSEIGQKQSKRYFFERYLESKKRFFNFCFETLVSLPISVRDRWPVAAHRFDSLPPNSCKNPKTKVPFFLSKSDFLVTHLSPDCGIFSRVRCKTGHRFLRDVAPKIWPFERIRIIRDKKHEEINQGKSHFTGNFIVFLKSQNQNF